MATTTDAPRDDTQLAELRAAFERGDVRGVRRRARRILASAASDEQKAAAREALAHTGIEPLAGVVLAGMIIAIAGIILALALRG